MQTATEYLRGLIHANGGAITVERFMQEALHHPQHGYYSRRVRDIGSRGDFATAVTLHPALPAAAAGWIISRRSIVKERGNWHLIELGGGTGEMATGVLNSLGWLGRRGLTYHLVEISAPLRAIQQEQTSRFAKRIRWHADVSAALAAANGKALIVSNEFVDAFPCVQLQRDETAECGWQEIAVSWPPDSAEPQETSVPFSPRSNTAASSNVMAHLRSIPESASRQKVEIHFSYQHWLKTLAANWRAGRMLTIDYGDEFPGLYHRQPAGTLRGYLHHQRVGGPAVFRNFGRQDLTADVNFSDLQRWGTELGFGTCAFDTQTDFLARYLPRKWIARADVDPVLSFLMNRDGAGSAFKVLEQSRDLP